MNWYTLKGTVGLGPFFATPPGPSHHGPPIPQTSVCWQPSSYHCHSHTLTVLASLAPADGAERLGPALVVSANGVSTVSWWLLP